MGDIVGMHAFRTGKAAHLAGVIASGDRLRIRLVAPAPDLRARIATPAFLCGPGSHAPDGAQTQRIPSAGPYYVAFQPRDQGRVLPLRNPNYPATAPDPQGDRLTRSA
jgi:hypothetical protein